MKHYIFRILFILLATPMLCFGQKKSPIITFENKVCNFGAIKYKPNSVLKIKFYYKNTGNAPLLINKVDASCGCTIPNWTKKPVITGTRDCIFVTFKMSRKTGIVNKNLFVNTNTDEKVTVLQIKGKII
jgi:hypothetical protein